MTTIAQNTPPTTQPRRVRLSADAVIGNYLYELAGRSAPALPAPEAPSAA